MDLDLWLLAHDEAVELGVAPVTVAVAVGLDGHHITDFCTRSIVSHLSGRVVGLAAGRVAGADSAVAVA